MTRIDQLLGGRGSRDEDSEPANLILVLKAPKSSTWDRWPRDATESVTAGDEVAVQLFLVAPLTPTHRLGGRVRVRGAESDAWLIGVETVQLNVLGFKHNLPPGGDGRLDQVAEHLVLRVNRDGAAGQPVQINPVGLSVEPQVDASMDKPFV